MFCLRRESAPVQLDYRLLYFFMPSTVCLCVHSLVAAASVSVATSGSNSSNLKRFALGRLFCSWFLCLCVFSLLVCVCVFEFIELLASRDINSGLDFSRRQTRMTDNGAVGELACVWSRQPTSLSPPSMLSYFYLSLSLLLVRSRRQSSCWASLARPKIYLLLLSFSLQCRDDELCCRSLLLSRVSLMDVSWPPPPLLRRY